MKIYDFIRQYAGSVKQFAINADIKDWKHFKAVCYDHVDISEDELMKASAFTGMPIEKLQGMFQP